MANRLLVNVCPECIYRRYPGPVHMLHAHFPVNDGSPENNGNEPLENHVNAPPAFQEFFGVQNGALHAHHDRQWMYPGRMANEPLFLDRHICCRCGNEFIMNDRRVFDEVGRRLQEEAGGLLRQGVNNALANRPRANPPLDGCVEVNNPNDDMFRRRLANPAPSPASRNRFREGLENSSDDFWRAYSNRDVFSSHPTDSDEAER